jgi:hypothetical protein
MSFSLRKKIRVSTRIWRPLDSTLAFTYSLDWLHRCKKCCVGQLLWPEQSILRGNWNPGAKTYAISGLSISWPIPLSTSQHGNFSISRQSWMENISIVLDMLFQTNYPLCCEWYTRLLHSLVDDDAGLREARTVRVWSLHATSYSGNWWYFTVAVSLFRKQSTRTRNAERSKQIYLLKSSDDGV